MTVVGIRDKRMSAGYSILPPRPLPYCGRHMRIAQGRMHLRVVVAHLRPHLVLRTEERGIDVWIRARNPATAHRCGNIQFCAGMAGRTRGWIEGEGRCP